MQIEFNKTGAERKALVSAISSITGEKAVYQFMPTCAYKIGNFTVTKDGALEFDDRIDSEDVETLLDQLAQQGFTAAETNMAEPEEPMGLTISVPPACASSCACSLPALSLPPASGSISTAGFHL